MFLGSTISSDKFLLPFECPDVYDFYSHNNLYDLEVKMQVNNNCSHLLSASIRYIFAYEVSKTHFTDEDTDSDFRVCASVYPLYNIYNN
jgi:hypothetical protein